MVKYTKLFTEVKIEPLVPPITPKEKIVLFGSCFANEIGEQLKIHGFNTLINPFGTLYNACSIYNSVKRISEGTKYLIENRIKEEYPFFSKNDVISHPDGYPITFSHHSSYGKIYKDDFINKINKKLLSDAEFFEQSSIVIITLGSSFVYRKTDSQNRNHDIINVEDFCTDIVSNCHKLPAKQFIREFVDVEKCTKIIEEIVKILSGKRIIFTVSPIRHLGDGAHENNISKSTLLIATQKIIQEKGLNYFPAYEIMMDELRDYRWYSEDLVHPTPMAVKYIFEKFKESYISEEYYSFIEKAFKEYKVSLHITQK